MIFTLKEFPQIDEKYYEGVHESGLTIYVIPKNHSTAYALFGTKFGSIDNHFIVDGNEIVLPDGIAHFLEHKLFENEDGSDTFSRYAKFGGSANAYTSSDMTAYLFSATRNIDDNLRILLDFVTHPYFTDETVQKEMGIIGEEIRMYDDNPNWRLYFNMLCCLFKDNPVRIDTAGSEKTISEITPQKLFDAYNSFYNLHNMALVVCGNITTEQVMNACDDVLPHTEVAKPSVKRIYPTEQAEVASKEICERMQVSMPMFCIGIKDKCGHLYGEALAKRSATYSILLEIMFGSSSRFFNENYASGLISKAFSAVSDVHECFAYCEISGRAENPDKVYEAVLAEVELFRKNGVDHSDFERAKRKTYSQSIMTFNSTDDIANSFLSASFTGTDIFEYPNAINNVTLDDVTLLLEENLSPEYFAISKILPIEEEENK